MKWTSFDSSWKALSNIFWVQLDPASRLAAIPQKLTVPQRWRLLSISVFLDLRSNPSFNKKKLKKRVVEQVKSYRLRPSWLKSEQNYLTLGFFQITKIRSTWHNFCCLQALKIHIGADVIEITPESGRKFSVRANSQQIDIRRAPYTVPEGRLRFYAIK